MGYEFYNRNDGLFAYFKLLLKKVFDILWKFLKIYLLNISNDI